MGENKRAYTYIDDAVDTIEYCIHDGGWSSYTNNIYTTAGSELISMNDVVKEIGSALKKTPKIILTRDKLPGDISSISAENFTNPAFKETPDTIKNIRKFVKWFKNYYHV